MPKVSVIVPVYNVEEYLRQALDSVVNQTLEDLEIICVDDCSTDNSLDILKEYASKDSRFKIYQQKENQGQGVARNIALDMATGEYIMFLDPDDWLDIHACEIAYNKIKKNNNDIVFFNFNYYKETPNTIIIKKSQHLKFLYDYLDNDDIKLYEIEGLTFTSAAIWCQIYNRKFLKDNNTKFSETRTCEDNPFYFTAICNAKSISVIMKEIYYYRMRVSTEAPYYIQHWKDVFKNKYLAYEVVKNCSNSNIFLKAYIPYYWNTIVFAHLMRAIEHNKDVKREIYKSLHKLAITLNKEYPMKNLKFSFNYENFKMFLYSDKPIFHKIIKIIYRIYSINGNSKHFIINFLGFKFAIKRREIND